MYDDHHIVQCNGFQAQAQQSELRVNWQWKCFVQATEGPKNHTPPKITAKGTGLLQTEPLAPLPVGGEHQEVIGGGAPNEAVHAAAQARTAVTLNITDDGNVLGTVEAKGWAKANQDPYESAKAMSLSDTYAEKIKTNKKDGTIIVLGNLSTWKCSAAGGVKSSAKNQDPVTISMTDLDTFDTVTTRLWDAYVEFVDWGSFDWENGSAQLDGGTGQFYVHMDPTYITSGWGDLLLKFENGIITESSDDGIWDGYLPGVGAPAQFDLIFGDLYGDVSLDVDFFPGMPTSVNGYFMDLTIEVSGAAEQMIVPEPGSALLIGAGAFGLMILRRKLRQN